MTGVQIHADANQRQIVPAAKNKSNERLSSSAGRLARLAGQIVSYRTTLDYGALLLSSEQSIHGLEERHATLLDCAHDNRMTVLISSHDLEEIETFATHIAFLRGGRLLFSEPIEVLLERCREVTVTFETEIADREITKLAAGCVAAEAQGAMLRFVDMRANVKDHEGAIRELMPEAVQVQSEGMNLKAIFMALNKGVRS